MSLIIDASVTVAWAFPDERTTQSDELRLRVRREGVVVPHHWAVEVANALLIAERRGRVTPDHAAEFADWLQLVAVEVDTSIPAVAWISVLPLARTHRLTAYDAAYLELAQRRGLPLATLDIDLARAATTAGVQLVIAEN